MFLELIFAGETIPFIEDNLSLDECIHIIDVAKSMFVLDDRNVIIDEDRVILHMRNRDYKPERALRKIKRLYCSNDKVLLQTPADYKDEIEPTKELLAYEKGIAPSQICVIEI